MYRVRALLQREQQFQLSIDEPNMDTEVAYQGREYPAFQSQEVQAVAALVRRKLLAGQTGTELFDVPCPQDVEIAAKFLRTLMQANGLSLGDIAKELDKGATLVLPSASVLRIG